MSVLLGIDQHRAAEVVQKASEDTNTQIGRHLALLVPGKGCAGRLNG